MGSFMIFDMDFKTQEDRLKFEKYLKKNYHQQRKLTNYHENDSASTWIVYYVGYLGYAEPDMILKGCLKEKIGIKFMAWLPISDTGSKWEKIRGWWNRQ